MRMPDRFPVGLSSPGPLFYKSIAAIDRLAKSAWYVSCSSGGSAGREDIPRDTQIMCIYV